VGPQNCPENATFWYACKPLNLTLPQTLFKTRPVIENFLVRTNRSAKAWATVFAATNSPAAF
jgi:hypothetical protein